MREGEKRQIGKEGKERGERGKWVGLSEALCQWSAGKPGFCFIKSKNK